MQGHNKGNYLTENHDISDEELDNLVKKGMNEINEEYKDYKREIFEFYDKESYDKVQGCIFELKTKSRGMLRR